MKVLVACEYSGIVRDAFLAAGHEAMSCDLLPTESPGPHYQGSVFDIIHEGFDLMVAHPPCTYLSYAGTAHWNAPGRAELREEALAFAMALYHCSIPLVAMENPKGWIGQAFRRADQYINPYDFGQPIRKRTGIWLKGLPLLQPTIRVPIPPPLYYDKSGKARHHTDSISSGPNQRKERARFFPGIAQAFAEQWGDVERLERLGKQMTLF